MACVVLDASMMGITGAPLADDPRVASRLSAAWDETLRSSFNHYPQGRLADVLATVRALDEAGVDLLIGSDVSQPLPFLGGLAHGASVHQELQYFVDAGISPTKALSCRHRGDRPTIRPLRPRHDRRRTARRPTPGRRRPDDHHQRHPQHPAPCGGAAPATDRLLRSRAGAVLHLAPRRRPSCSSDSERVRVVRAWLRGRGVVAARFPSREGVEVQILASAPNAETEAQQPPGSVR